MRIDEPEREDQKFSLQKQQQFQSQNTKNQTKIVSIDGGGGVDVGDRNEPIYAVADKSKKTSKKADPFVNDRIDLEGKENRPVPPIRSSSTLSNVSLRNQNVNQNNVIDQQLDQKQSKQNHQSQKLSKPKPPIRVASMHYQQKPEVSPKPKNLLIKSNTQ
ncbi:hypothetical protein QR98_0077000 [Sarcoptes scabiei]|uniref:Uncharacterized protein n=1 Tax=Sarcoptes scabiei TaxID=52283 RepID=A0A132AE12_SARSC|nr:hypothetical protein QR98_0077000 [Sarcoptes scabiei]